MHEFQTPEPITAVIELGMAEVRIEASDRPDTVVEVRPSDPGRPPDVTAADQVRVEYSAGRLLIEAAGRWRSWSPFGYGGSVDVHVALPTGSQVRGVVVGAFRCTGALGEAQIKSSVGDIHLQQAGALTLATSAGDITVERATGNAGLSTASGEIRVGDIDGAVEVRNSNGDTHLGQVTAEVQVKAANGDITVERADSSVTAKSANGDIRLGAVQTGSVNAQTGFGAVEVGIADGTAAWLDLNTGYGQIRNALDTSGPPGPDDARVEVRAQSGYGDITIRRSYAPERAEAPA